MKILITGALGQLGYDVCKELVRRGYQIVKSDLQIPEGDGIPLDVTNRDRVHAALREAQPDAVIHCAAWTAVDAAEDNVRQVHNINGLGTRNIAEACREIGCKLVYLSTDYVFNGCGKRPWQPDDECGPLNVYGQSKLEGERAICKLMEKYFIVRTAWVFGAHGKNFVRTMLDVGRRYDSVRVVCDQIGTPTYTPDLARLLADMVETDRYGKYHATNEGGYISWYEFCCEIYRQAGLNTKVDAVTTEEYALNRAKRPFNSRLDKRKLAKQGFSPLPDWRDALARYLMECEKEELP